MCIERDNKLKRSYKEKVDSLIQWKGDLVLLLYKESQEKQKVEKNRRKRQAIANEKRKWMIRHSLSSGKLLEKKVSHFNTNGNVESREQILMKILRMQTYFTQLSQLENVIKPLDKVAIAW